jgi:hypothetical protein
MSPKMQCFEEILEYLIPLTYDEAGKTRKQCLHDCTTETKTHNLSPKSYQQFPLV